MSTYSNRIRELRKNKSLSQEQLADKLGVTKQAVSQMERGARKPSVTMLEALCDFFNVSTDYLLGKEDVTIRIVDGDGIRKLDSVRRICRRFSGLICGIYMLRFPMPKSACSGAVSSSGLSTEMTRDL